ncbi:MAG: hypothetical protein QOF78_3568 [Phycisphaerales bacterium]|nr:hypothetical protein [Phycisphaerales bacterium]
MTRMIRLILFLLALTSPAACLFAKSIRDFQVLPSNDAATNKANLQKAIDWASERGAALEVDASDEPYRIDGGIVLKLNVSLVGVHGPVGRGTKHPTKAQPVGSVFAIEDEKNPFITVEGATQIRGVQFWYPKQTLTDPKKVIEYPPTIQASREKAAQGVTLTNLTFYGEFIAMDFNCPPAVVCEQILIEHCYGYPLSGQFVRIDYCYDIPRILHCHVNPANQRFFAGGFSKAVNDSVIARKTFAYAIDHTDNAQVIDVFTFATFGGIRLGAATYGQMTNFNFDCVTVGIHKLGDNTFNRNWQIAQGSIIANVSPDGEMKNIHPIIVEGSGHTAISNVEAFAGPNPAVSALSKSRDFLLVRGEKKLTVSLFGCRMRNYEADEPMTIENPRALIQAVACVNKKEKAFNRTVEPKDEQRAP